MTTRGLKDDDVVIVADLIDRAMSAKDEDEAALKTIRCGVADFYKKFPMPHGVLGVRLALVTGFLGR